MFLQIGLGSMGKRRVRNLLELQQNQILGFDPREDRREEASSLYGIQTVDDLEKVNWNQISHLVISTPPDRHLEYVNLAVEKNVPCFIEASVVDDGYTEVMKNLPKDLVIAPSCTMRFDPIVAKAKEVLDSGLIGKVLFVNHHFGQYLPNWHPWEDIKDFYVSKPETGAAREIVPFDLVYLTWLFGFPKNMTAMKMNSGTLGVEIDDVYSLIYQVESGPQVCFNIEVVSKESYRKTIVVGSQGNMEIDNVSGELRVMQGDKNLMSRYKRSGLSVTRSSEEMYVLEMRKFLNACKGEETWDFTLHEDHKILDLLYIAEKAFETGQIQKVELHD